MEAVATGRQIARDLAAFQDGLGVIEEGLRADELELQQPASKARLLPGDGRGGLAEVAEPAGVFSSRSEFVTCTPARRSPYDPAAPRMRPE